jgi:cytochrome b involved in lipid metabolism
MNILLSIKGHIYEVSHFVKNHPGEGINNMYLNEHNRRNVSLLFNKFHSSDESEEHLINSRNNNHSEIKYLGPDYFHKKIPKYYHYIKDITKIKTNNIDNKSFLMFQSDESNTINLFVKDGMGMITVHHMELDIKDNKLVDCYVELCDSVDKEKNIITNSIKADSIEEFIEKYFINQKYTPIYKV